MSQFQNEQHQEPLEGSRCVAGPGGTWGLATIHRANEDGTYNIEFDVYNIEFDVYNIEFDVYNIEFDVKELVILR